MFTNNNGIYDPGLHTSPSTYVAGRTRSSPSPCQLMGVRLRLWVCVSVCTSGSLACFGEFCSSSFYLRRTHTYSRAQLTKVHLDFYVVLVFLLRRLVEMQKKTHREEHKTKGSNNKRNKINLMLGCRIILSISYLCHVLCNILFSFFPILGSLLTYFTCTLVILNNLQQQQLS